MDQSLYDAQLDGIPPIVGSARPVHGPDGKAGLPGKKLADALREHPFVEWVLGLSIPALAAVGIAVGVLLSTPLVIAFSYDRREYLLLFALLIPAPVLWAIRNRPIVLPRRRGPTILARSRRADPAAAKPRRSPGPLDIELSLTFLDADERFRARFLRVTGSNAKKVLWCLAMPVAMYLHLAAGCLLLMMTYGIPQLFAARYGPCAPGSLPAIVIASTTGLNVAAVIAPGVVSVGVSGLCFDLYIVAATVWALVGPIVAIRTCRREGASGWDRFLEIVFDPMVRISLVGVMLAEKMLDAACRATWWLVGWAPAPSGPPGDSAESVDGGADSRGGRTRMLAGLTDTPRGYALVALAYLQFATATNAAVVTACLIGRIACPSAEQLGEGRPAMMETLAVALVLAGMTFGVASSLVRIRGPRSTRLRLPDVRAFAGPFLDSLRLGPRSGIAKGNAKGNSGRD